MKTGTPPIEVIIDVDVYFTEGFNPDPSPTNLRPYLERLRTLKNRTFFAHVTEEAVKLWS